MSEKTIRHVIRFPPDVYDKLREIAKDEDRSINWEVVAAVRLLVERHARDKAGARTTVELAARVAGEGE